MDRYGNGLSQDSPVIEQVLAPFKKFARVEAAGGVLLIICAAAALFWSNSKWAESYFSLWNTVVTVGFGEAALAKPLLLWVNDGLMAMFFFTVGLEIKREILVGELNSARQAALPVAAALGGMIVPALVYVAFNAGTESADGWGVPMATDIAFALGVLSLLGDRVPTSLKVFLAAVAIVDDIGAILVIAVFYTSDISVVWLAIGGGAFLLMLLINFIGARTTLPYLLLGLILWLAFLKSGVHATVAGVLGAMAIPATTRIKTSQFVRRAQSLVDKFEAAFTPGHSVLTNKHQLEALEELEDVCRKASTPLQTLEHGMHSLTAFFVMPVFALANAGVSLAETPAGVFSQPVSLGIIFGLLLGKQAGVTLGAWLAFRTGLAARRPDVSMLHYYGASWLTAIGFTMSIFIAGLAFEDGGALHNSAKVAVLASSLAAGVGGWCVLRFFARPVRETA